MGADKKCARADKPDYPLPGPSGDQPSPRTRPRLPPSGESRETVRSSGFVNTDTRETKRRWRRCRRRLNSTYVHMMYVRTSPA